MSSVINVLNQKPDSRISSLLEETIVDSNFIRDMFKRYQIIASNLLQALGLLKTNCLAEGSLCQIILLEGGFSIL